MRFVVELRSVGEPSEVLWLSVTVTELEPFEIVILNAASACDGAPSARSATASAALSNFNCMGCTLHRLSCSLKPGRRSPARGRLEPPGPEARRSVQGRRPRGGRNKRDAKACGREGSSARKSSPERVGPGTAGTAARPAGSEPP